MPTLNGRTALLTVGFEPNVTREIVKIVRYPSSDETPFALIVHPETGDLVTVHKRRLSLAPYMPATGHYGDCPTYDTLDAADCTCPTAPGR
jgi:hypothetical protein